MEQRISPDERITLNALSSPDPFAKPGQVIPPVNQNRVAKKTGRKPKLNETTEKEYRNVDIGTREDEKPIVESKIESAIPKEECLTESVITESRSVDGLPNYRCEFAGRDIFVGFSCYKATNPITSFALINMALDFGKDKIRFDFSTSEDTFYHSRNALAKKFLETDAKWLLLIDNDIIPSIGRPAWAKASFGAASNVLDSALQRHVIHRLVGANKTLVGGAYFKTHLPDSIVCSNKELGLKAKSYTDQITEVDWIGSGCLLIHRKVLLAMAEKNPNLNGNFFYPDDISFCKRAKDAGHPAHIDLGLPVFYLGHKSY